MSFKKRIIKQHKSWTPTKLAQYEECPAKAMYKHIDKLPEPPSPALDRGTEIHDAAANYITRRKPGLHDALHGKKTKKQLALLQKEYKAKKVRVELELAFTKEWKPCHWLAKDVYVRFKIDVVHFLKAGRVRVIDWKTGKFKPNEEYNDQLEAYQLALLVSGLAKEVESTLWFTDSDDVVDSEDVYTLKDLPALKAKWEKRAKPMLSDTKHAPRPGKGCWFCPFSTNKGGPCEF